MRKMIAVHRVLAACALAATALYAPAMAQTAHVEGGYAVSTDSAVAADQRAAYEVVHRYETLLNAGDTAGILDLFAPESVAEWNNLPTAATVDERRRIYDALFRTAKFSTVFGYAAVNAYGDTAVVRTFHHEGATVLEGGKKVVDLNREVFVLRRMNGRYQIVLYIFNTDPVQGEG